MDPKANGAAGAIRFRNGNFSKGAPAPLLRTRILVQK
jgi:hypothetical protein